MKEMRNDVAHAIRAEVDTFFEAVEKNEDVIKTFIKLMEQQGMEPQSQGFKEVLNYIVKTQAQLQTMATELQEVKEQLADVRKEHPELVSNKFLDGATDIQKKTLTLSEHMSELKEHLIDIAARAVNAFKEKGKEEMSKVVQKGISVIKGMLEERKEGLEGVLTDYEKIANQIDGIGMELKQIGTSFANVGRIMTGKEAQELSDDKIGIGLTRTINAPVKKNIAVLQEKINGIDKMIGKMDKISAGLDSSKNRISMKERLAEMKEKSAKQQVSERPEVEKSQKKEECL